MRVAYVCADAGVPVFGSKGCSIHVQEVVRALRGFGDDVFLFASRLGGVGPPDLDAPPVFRLTRGRLSGAATRERAALVANSSLDRALRRLGPFDLVYERHSLWSFSAMEFARGAGIPGILEVNAPLVDEQRRYRRLDDPAGAEEAAHRAFRAASAILAVSREIARWLEIVPAARGKVHIVPNGVRPARFANVVPRWPRSSTSFTVGFLGSLKPWHGLPVLAEAFADFHRRAPESRLLVVGDGPERETLERDLDHKGVADSACVTGAVPPDDVPGWLASMDAAAAPYPSASTLYFSPLKIFEYMAAGLPIVASRAGQLEEMLDDGVDAVLCPPGDAGALADALDRLRGDPELRARLGRSAREKAIRVHTWEAVAGRIRGIAALCAAGGGSTASTGGAA